MEFIKKIVVPKERAFDIDFCLSYEPHSQEECLGEDFQIVFTADFGNGLEMDIKLCGVSYEEENCNLPWTEAVLFRNGCELTHSEVSDEYFGLWELEYDGDVYSCLVEREGE